MTIPIGSLPAQREPERVQQTGTRETSATSSRGPSETLLVIERRGGKFQQGEGGSNFFKKDGSIDIDAYLASKTGLSESEQTALRAELETANKYLTAACSSEALDAGGVKKFELKMDNGSLQWSFTLRGDLPDNPITFSTADFEKYVKNGKANSKLFEALNQAFQKNSANKSAQPSGGMSIAETVHAAGELGIELGDTNPGAEMFAEAVEEQSKAIDESLKLRDKKIEEKQAETKDYEALLVRQLNITSLEAEAIARSMQGIA